MLKIISIATLVAATSVSAGFLGNNNSNWGPFDSGSNLGPMNSGSNWGPFNGGSNWGPFNGGSNAGPFNGAQNWGPFQGGNNWLNNTDFGLKFNTKNSTDTNASGAADGKATGVVDANAKGTADAYFKGQADAFAKAQADAYAKGFADVITSNISDQAARLNSKSINQISNCNNIDNVDKGTLVGLVENATDKKPLNGVKVTINTESCSQSVFTQPDGSYTLIDIPTGEGVISITNNGYVSESINTTISANESTVIQNIRYIPISNKGSGVAQGVITDATTGKSLNNVVLMVRKGLNNTSGDLEDGLNISTDSLGVYSLDLASGNYTIEATKDDYIKSYYNVLLLGGKKISDQNFTISPILIGSTGQLRVVLTWEKDPRDLDSHLLTPNNDHVFWKRKAVSGVNLDVDDENSYGPETITITDPQSGSYNYYVKQYAGSSDLTHSRAKVELFDTSGLIKTFNVPGDSGGNGKKFWKVFSFDGASYEITPFNELEESMPF